jgi:hypothetical protein
VARDGRITDDRHFELGEGQRLDDLLASHHAVDELLLRLDPPVRVAVADLRRRDLLELGLVGVEDRLAKHLDVLGDRRLVGGRLDAREATEQQAGDCECHCASNCHVTTRHFHSSLLDTLRVRAPNYPFVSVRRSDWFVEGQFARILDAWATPGGSSFG